MSGMILVLWGLFSGQCASEREIEREWGEVRK